MATVAANKRLTREYKSIVSNPPPYITAHPSETNILEWHYLLTGPPATPYEGGQYWGTLVFPPDYPFKPPAIRMITPSGRFQTSTRLCLSISDFHPKSFNPAWEVSTILIGLLSFMTSEEMTTGSISTSDRERRLLAQTSRWWNSTGGGSGIRGPDGRVVHAGTVQSGRKTGLGDAGKRFRAEWPDIDEENWKWMKDRGIDPLTGGVRQPQWEGPTAAATAVPPTGNLIGMAGGGGPGGQLLRRRAGTVQSVGVGGAQQAGAVVMKGEGWIRRHRVLVGFAVVVGYVLLARAFE